MFSLNKSQEIADLQAQVIAQTEALDAANVQLSEANTNLQTVTAERDTALAALQVEKDKVAAAEHLIAEANGKIAKIEAESEAKIAAEVTSRLAAAGTDPIARAPERSADAPESKKAARVEGLSGIAKARAALESRRDAIASARKN